MSRIDRRDFMKLAGLGGVVFASGLGFSAFGGNDALETSTVQKSSRLKSAKEDFYFVQFSDTHWGFEGPKVNPDAQVTLKKAVAAVNSLEEQPDFVVFTGDLTHTTDDPKVRRTRMAEFREIVGQLKAKMVHFMPGEHDASLDRGEAYQEFFGDLHYTFDHRGVHFIVLDNVSDPEAIIGQTQLAWLQADLKQQRIDTPIVVLTHRPLFDLYPQWDWTTRDAASVINTLMPYKNVTVFYGHIHQEHHYQTGHIAHHAAKSLIFPLPAPGSVPKRAPVLWDPSAPYKGLGFRNVGADVRKAHYEITELPVTKG
ncbi:MAG: metallophosphoesterase [Acidobacteria bacterium]|nr:metallophosphoesterase [Acidobacteriota bacterium]